MLTTTLKTNVKDVNSQRVYSMLKFYRNKSIIIFRFYQIEDLLHFSSLFSQISLGISQSFFDVIFSSFQSLWEYDILIISTVFYLYALKLTLSLVQFVVLVFSLWYIQCVFKVESFMGTLCTTRSLYTQNHLKKTFLNWWSKMYINYRVGCKYTSNVLSEYFLINIIDKHILIEK